MEYSKVAEKFGPWARYWRPFIESEKMDKIFRELGSRKARSIKTAPLSSDVFRCFKECDPDRLHVILAGICPYHKFIDDKPVADGLMMSTRNGKIQPSLYKVYENWDKQYGPEPNIWKGGDLSYLSMQGVLLYNVALTVQQDKALSDNELWGEFNKFFWEEIIAKHFSGICIVLMGQAAHKSAAYINPLQHYQWCVDHPAYAARNQTAWNDKGVFKEIDKILWENNKKKIYWIDDVPF